MRTFTGTVKTFNGRYWKSYPAREEASTIGAAARRAIESVPLKPRERVEEVQVHLRAIKNSQPQVVEAVEDGEANASNL